VIAVDHIAIAARDPEASARFLAEILGLAPAEPDGAEGDMFKLKIGHDTSLLFASSPTVASQHIAFRVDERAFAAVVDRLRARNVAFGNDPDAPRNGLIDDPLGGRGRVYFVDVDQHLFEVTA
jgi:catechol 2,3-dioxygenase-like lactoylglutathione lyase family enzyme